MCSLQLHMVRSPHSHPEPQLCLSSQALVCSQASWMLEGRDTFFQRYLSKYGHVVWKSLFSVITLYVQMKKMPTAFLIQTLRSQVQYSFLVPGPGGVGTSLGEGPSEHSVSSITGICLRARVLRRCKYDFKRVQLL